MRNVNFFLAPCSLMIGAGFLYLLFLLGQKSSDFRCQTPVPLDEGCLGKAGARHPNGEGTSLVPVIHLYDSRHPTPDSKRKEILTGKDAQQHKDFEVLPTVNPREYEIACFLRHLAMAARSLSFCPTEETSRSCGFIPCLISGTAEEYLRVSHLLANLPWREHKGSQFSYNGKDHVSDMLGFRFLSELKPPALLTFHFHTFPFALINGSLDCRPRMWRSEFNISVHTSYLIVQHSTDFMQSRCINELSKDFFMCSSRSLLMLIVSNYIELICSTEKSIELQ
eukprot:g32253.t1